MTRNLRTQLANAAERWMRAWAGDDLTRESAEVLYTYWDLADPNDDELRAEVLSRFPASEPPAVAGLDFLAVEQDAKTIVAEVVAEPISWSRYGVCPTCGVIAGACVFVNITNRLGESRTTPHQERPLVEVTA